MAVSTNTRAWLHGIGAAFIGAGATSLSTTFAAPTQFNFTTRLGLQHLAIVCLVSGIGAVATYLAKSPLPLSSVTATETTHATAPDGTTKETTSAVKIE